uniref:RPN1 N-terminal domain-containing protein n=1 Tax=Sinocyclocheilus rhinocerous TaxID=307959 RepID=A0A673KHE4_9TELE
MEETAKKEKKQSEITEEKDKQPAGKDKEKKGDQELVRERKKTGEKDTSLYRPALEELRRQIRSSTTSMTSVPKPLKFLRPHYAKLKDIYQNMAPGENKQFCADVVSVLAMTMSSERECLKYRLLGSQEELASWGHEYVRHLAGEVAKEWQEIEEGDKAQQEVLLKLVKEIVPYNMAHNAEHEACDLLMEIERLDMLDTYIDENAYAKVCLYLTSCVSYVPEPENSALLKCALNIFRKFNRYPEALRLALMLNDVELVENIFTSCKDIVIQKQMSFMLGRHGMFLELNEDVEDCEDLTEIMSNVQLNSNFLALARELDIMEPKVPDDIYKTHLENNRFGSSGSQVDSARMNLASSLVNGFVNAAFGQDKLLTEDGNKWLYKNKDHGMLSAAASLGMILLWDVDGGLTQIDKYLYSSEDYIKSGALLACGIVNSGVRNECDPALALLSDYVLHNSNIMRIGAIETTLAALQVVPEPFRSFSNTLVDVCAYAGSGNVLKVQQLQHICSEHYDNKDKDDDKDKKDKKDKDKKETTADMGSHQGVAVLGIALIAMGEEIGSEMALRTFGHLLRYGEPTLRRAVPLALALISVSNPRLNILDTLSKFSHDADPEVSHNAIFAMGMVGSGTNNARLAAMLRQLAQYHAKDPNNLFMVRLAQVRLHVSQQHFRSCDSLSFLFVAAVVSTVNERWDLRHINTLLVFVLILVSCQGNISSFCVFKYFII